MYSPHVKHECIFRIRHIDSWGHPEETSLGKSLWTVPFATAFPEFEGTEDYQTVRDFMRDRIVEMNEDLGSSKPVFAHMGGCKNPK